MTNFYVPALRPTRYRITGKTRDATGDILPGCTVMVYESVSGDLRGETVSDGNGNYSIDVTGTAESGGLLFFAVAFYPNSPLRAGCTLNTLAGDFA